MDSEDGKLWTKAMVEEMTALDKNQAWDLVELSTRRKPIGNKWVFKKKMNAEGKVEKYKARLVLKFEFVRAKTITSRGYKFPCVFIEVVLLYSRFLKCKTFIVVCRRKLEIYINGNGKCFFIFF